MCVNCMMKPKPLVLNEKYESGPGRAGGLRTPGVWGKQPESRASLAWWPCLSQGMEVTRAMLTCLSEGWPPLLEKAGTLPNALKKLRHVLRDAL